MSKHTPGPWVIKLHQGAGNLFRLDNQMSANEFVSSCEANRRLVEAAPEMLEALRQIAVAFRDGGSHIERVAALITADKARSKAQGAG